MISLDNIFVFLFFSITIYFLIVKGSKDSNINTYAVGRREFSTFALAATITATFTSGSGFITHFSHSYFEGFKHIIPATGVIIYTIFMLYFIIPKCKNILGETSVASVMGKKYGVLMQNIVAITGVIGGCASIAVQIKIFGIVGQFFYPNISAFIFSFCGTLFVILYSAFGGITHVVRTDIIQAIAFSLSLLILFSLTYNDVFNNPAQNLHNLQFIDIYNYSYDDWLDIFILGLFFAVPTMSPATFQRLSMGLNIMHLKKSWFYSSIIQIIIVFFSCYIGLFFLVLKPDLNYQNILGELIIYYEIPGLKGLLLIGLLSMIMSTADSYLNISSVLIANDTYFFQSYNDIQKLYIARIVTFVLGFICLFGTLVASKLLDIVFMFKSFYVPVVTVPVLAYVMGFNIPKKSVYLAMISGFSFVIISWIIKTSFQPMMPGFFINLLVLIISSYYLKRISKNK